MKTLLSLVVLMNIYITVSAQTTSNTDYMIVSENFTVCDQNISDSIEIVMITHGFSQPRFDITPTALSQEPVLDRISTGSNYTWVFKLPVKQQYIDLGQVEISVGRNCQITDNYNADAECHGLSSGTQIWTDNLVITLVENSIQPMATKVIGADRADTEINLESPRYGHDYPFIENKGDFNPPYLYSTNGAGVVSYVNTNYPISTGLEYAFEPEDLTMDTLVFIHPIEADYPECASIQDTTLVVFDLINPITDEAIELGLETYPNPVSGTLKIKLPEQAINAQLLLFNSNGEEIADFGSFSSTICEVSLDRFPDGVYTIHVVSNDETFVKQIVKQ